MTEERPRLQAAVRAGADKDSLQKLDQKIRLWEEILETAAIVTPSPEGDTRIRFGSTVRIRDAAGQEESYRIVGVDEIDIDRGWISWISPLAKALVNTQAGQKVQVKLPGGNRELTVIQVSQETQS